MIQEKQLIADHAVTKRIKELSKEFHKVLIKIRRSLHMYPELGFEEYRTSKFIAKTLLELGLEVQEGVVKTGVVGLLRGKKPGKTIAIRADMDALPVQEENNISYKSQYDGKMHACGHDVHITVALGAAMVLSKMKDQLCGNVKFIFQPAEETTGGAKPMIEEGVLENPKVEAIIGGHVWSEVPSGKIAVKQGAIMASTDMFEIKIKGKGGHAAKPDQTIDPVTLGSEVVCALQKIVSRQTDPLDSVVLSVGAFQSGNAFNVIPHEAIVRGTVRTLNNEIRKQIPKRMEGIIRGIVEPYGGSYEFNYMNNYPVTENDSDMTNFMRNSAAKIIGTDNVLSVERPSMGGEDFSYFLQKIPGTFIWIGIRNEEKQAIYDIHHPKFNIDEDILESTTSIYVQTIVDFLNNTI